MFVLLLCLALTRQVLTRDQLPPPQDVRVDQWRLNWTPAAGDQPVRYTVRYNSFGSTGWLDVPGCVRIASNSCDTSAVKDTGEQGCVRLQLWAESGPRRSEPVEACSRHGATCTPEISLTALPGSLTVHLSKDHSLTDEYGGNARHRVYFGKEGEPLEQRHDDAVSSVTVPGLEAGQRYCMKVQYVVMHEPVGPPSCPRCERIPEPKSAQTGVIAAVVVVVLLTVTAVLILYVLIFHYETVKRRIRRWLQPYEIQPHIDDIKPSLLLVEPPVERYDPVTIVSPLQHDE